MSDDIEAWRNALLERQRELERLIEFTSREGESSPELEGEGDVADLGSDLLEREQAASIRESVQERLTETLHALERLESGTYGICEACGEPIPRARLEARPEARYCLTHQKELSA
ncbi:MAG: TraR/DksA family transcriptional regulator [Actinomycetota bacterium]